MVEFIKKRSDNDCQCIINNRVLNSKDFGRILKYMSDKFEHTKIAEEEGVTRVIFESIDEDYLCERYKTYSDAEIIETATKKDEDPLDDSTTFQESQVENIIVENKETIDLLLSCIDNDKKEEEKEPKEELTEKRKNEDIAQRVLEYAAAHPEADIICVGIDEYMTTDGCKI